MRAYGTRQASSGSVGTLREAPRRYAGEPRLGEELRRRQPGARARAALRGHRGRPPATSWLPAGRGAAFATHIDVAALSCTLQRAATAARGRARKR